jgi:hypothetical protein
VLVYGTHEFLQPDGNLVPPPPAAHPTGWVYESFLNKYCMISPGQALTRASALERVGGFDPELWGVDYWDLYLRLAKEDLVELEAGEKTRSMYSLDYFLNMVKAVKSGEDVTLNLGTDYPVKLEFQMADGGGHCVYLLAPRIESD